MEVKIVELEPKRALAIRETFEASKLGDKFGEIYSEIGAYMQANNIQFAGAPFGIYHAFSPESIDLEAGMPVSDSPEGEGRIHFMNTYGGKAAMTVFMGHYDKLKEAWREFAKLVDAEYKLAGPCFEVYITDPGEEPDSSKWITELYTPIMN